MICFPAVKINIGLSILNKRCDEFHNIQSIFYPVNNYTDCIEIIESNTFHFEKFGIAVPGNESDNLCIKAYDVLKRDFHLPAVTIRLLKRIPSGAGLGGGSSNASSTLILLNDLFNLHLSFNALTKYAANLGSDCPFFIHNQPASVTGRGDIIEPVKLNLKGYYLTIINPGFPISTKLAYENINFSYQKVDFKSAVQQPINLWKDLIWNDFEQFAFLIHPELSIIKKSLYDVGALFASMTGSGSSVYGLSDVKLNIPQNIEKFNFWQGKMD